MEILTNTSHICIPQKHPYTQTDKMYSIERQIAGIFTRGMQYTFMEKITDTTILNGFQKTGHTNTLKKLKRIIKIGQK